MEKEREKDREWGKRRKDGILESIIKMNGKPSTLQNWEANKYTSIGFFQLTF